MTIYCAQKCRWTPKIGSWGPVYCHCRLAGTISKGQRNLGGSGAPEPPSIFWHIRYSYINQGEKGQIMPHILLPLPPPMIFRPSVGPNILSPIPLPFHRISFSEVADGNHFIHIISSIESSTKFTPVLT